ISDIVMSGVLPEKIQNAAEMYAGCISGAMQKNDYLTVIHNAGFQNVSIRTEKEIQVPDDILLDYLSADELKNLKDSGVKIESITVTAEKAKSECCSSSGCC
ncbi:MAG TPA: arsenite S-adenosylmethyltransferase, partial [Leptospiraceae bacterium]|nr:arsenite S-adenosylmethyltransferase [Leptospiraceae bacterium]